MGWRCARPESAPAIGGLLAIIPSHICLVVNLFDTSRGRQDTELLEVTGQGKVM